MEKSHVKLGTFVWRITAAHTVSYFIAGIFALFVMKYNQSFGTGDFSFMRPTDSVWVAAGPGLQIIRGILLSLFLYPFRTIFTETRFGWIKFASLLFGTSYLLTFAAATGSFEGIIYTNLPFQAHLGGIPEMVLYLSLFTLGLWGWFKKPLKVWNVLSIVLVILIMLMSVLGGLAASGVISVN